MFNAFTAGRGGVWDRRILRLAIWSGLVVYAVYLCSAALAGQAESKARAFGRWAARTAVASMFDGNKPEPSRATYGGIRHFSSKDKRLAFQRPTTGEPHEEIACLALNIYFEARGEPDEGKLAVGHVVMNRVLSGRFPSTICQVVQQGGEVRRHRCQFSWWCDGRSDRPRNKQDWERSNEFALAVYWGQTKDPTDGALWYHADYVNPAWRSEFELGPKIGRHIFYRQTRPEFQLASQVTGS